MTEIGEPIGIALPALIRDPEDEEPEASLRARWSRRAVNPDHNRRWPPNNPPTPPRDQVPRSARAHMLVRTRHVPDGTSATITVHHCHTDAQVTDGSIDGLEVRGNRVIDPDTGRAPFFVFEAKHTPWDPWDKPFFYFKISVDHQGLQGETPKDYGNQIRRVLRVRYWHACVSDGIADTPAGGGLSTRSEMWEIARLLRRRHHRVYKKTFNQNNVPVNLWGSVLRNTYAYHHASHGNIFDFSTNQALDEYECPTDGALFLSPADPPQCPTHGVALVETNPARSPVGSWQSVVVLGSTSFGASQVNQVANVPSVPRYLVYLDICAAAWEPSLGNAFINRGTQNYLAFRSYIPDGDARLMARRFYRKWAGTHRCNPNRIAQVFWDVGAPFYNSMRPVLMGSGGGQISSQQATNELNEAIAGIVAEIDDMLNF